MKALVLFMMYNREFTEAASKNARITILNLVCSLQFEYKAPSNRKQS